MASIYNVSKWLSSSTYKKNDFVEDSSISQRYWYSSQDDNNSNSPAVGSAYWNGNINITIDGATSVEPYFFWDPSYNLTVSHEPKINSIQFGEGY